MLEVSSLHVNLSGMSILSDISLSVNEGEIVTTIGSNGAGKTSLLRAISGLVPVKSGQIQFEGESIVGLRPDKIVSRGISQIPERGRVFANMSIYDHLVLGAWTRKDSNAVKKDIELIYELFPILKKRKNQLAGTLSGGERQMVAIGRALMARPKMLLLDEPTLGLAPIMCLHLINIIKEINKLGTSVLLIEQNANLALSVSNRGYVLETGRITLQGESNDLIGNPDVRKSYLGLN